MEFSLAKEVIECLPKERTLYHYYKDRYAAYLLEQEIAKNGDIDIGKYRKCSSARLLEKPAIKKILQTCGGKKLSQEHLESLWNRQCETYVMTLGTWGSDRSYQHYQISRPGQNLVLQMNFNGRHDENYRHCIMSDPYFFMCAGHPINHSKVTLAWARLDFDLVTGEALIEEIQTDWLRQVGFLLGDLERASACDEKAFEFYGERIYVDRATRYFRDEIAKHKVLWSEAMLNAAIQFLHEEIGLSTVYYHTFETGALLKNIKYDKPPKSLYTKLPKQFCFEQVAEGPSFILADKQARRRLKKAGKPQWFRLSL